MTVGETVRLVRLVGVASAELRAHRGETGTVTACRERAGSVVYGVRFGCASAWGGTETWWLRADEVEPA